MKIDLKNKTIIKYITSNKERHFEWLKAYAAYINLHYNKVDNEAIEHADGYIIISENLKNENRKNKHK
jgi:hypothetical protein